MRHLLLLVLVSAAACARTPKDSRERAAAALKERLGEAADPHVAFQKDSTHLLVQLATAAFPTMSETNLTDQATGIATFALRHYEKQNQLDSITVVYREKAAPGFWWIRHQRTFPVESLLK